MSHDLVFYYNFKKFLFHCSSLNKLKLSQTVIFFNGQWLSVGFKPHKLSNMVLLHHLNTEISVTNNWETQIETSKGLYQNTKEVKTLSELFNDTVFTDLIKPLSLETVVDTKTSTLETLNIVKNAFDVNTINIKLPNLSDFDDFTINRAAEVNLQNFYDINLLRTLSLNTAIEQVSGFSDSTLDPASIKFLEVETQHITETYDFFLYSKYYLTYLKGINFIYFIKNYKRDEIRYKKIQYFNIILFCLFKHLFSTNLTSKFFINKKLKKYLITTNNELKDKKINIYDNSSILLYLYNMSVKLQSIANSQKMLKDTRISTFKLLHSLFWHNSFNWILTQKSKKRNFLKYLTLKKFFIKKNVLSFSLMQRTFVTKKNMLKTLMTFLYRSTKQRLKMSSMFQEHYSLKPLKREKCLELNNVINLRFKNSKKTDGFTTKYFLNLHRHVIWKMRNARYTHWNLRTIGKLNKYRYDKLLVKDLNNKKNTSLITFLFYILLTSYGVRCTWKQLLLLIDKQLIVYNGVYLNSSVNLQKGDIIELPFGNYNFRAKGKIKKYYNTLFAKAKKKNYLQYINRKKIIRNKSTLKIAKIFKKLPTNFAYFGHITAYDPILNTFGIIHHIPRFKDNIYTQILNKSVLSLYNWRYNFD